MATKQINVGDMATMKKNIFERGSNSSGLEGFGVIALVNRANSPRPVVIQRFETVLELTGAVRQLSPLCALSWRALASLALTLMITIMKIPRLIIAVQI